MKSKRSTGQRMGKAEWRRFEEAVLRFAKTLDPSSEVLFDHSVPDRETGVPRQCDVWINARFGGHWPLSIYVSCKDRRKSQRKLGSPDIDNFYAETIARQASMGVIYTNTGFAKPALEKAAKLHISCCRLYQRESADIPAAVWIAQYVCRPGIMVEVTEKPTEWPHTKWNDIFDIRLDNEPGNASVMDVIGTDFLASEQVVYDAVKKKGAPPDDWQSQYTVAEVGWKGSLVFTVYGHWKVYKAQTEGHLLDGSYVLGENGGFQGRIEGPSIDMQSAHPGPHWVETAPEEMRSQTSRLGMVFYATDFEQSIRRSIGEKTVPNPGAQDQIA